MPTTDGMKGALTEAMGGEAESAGKGVGGKIASFAKKAMAAAAIGKFLKDTIMEGARYEQARGGIETLFGAKGAKSVEEYAALVGKSVSEVQGEYARLKGVEDNVMKNANNAWKTAGISANEYMEQTTSIAASLLQSVGGDQAKAAEIADKAVIQMADNANKMGTDMQSIQNAYQGFAKGNYTMLDNLKLGYGGTKEEMERLLADAEKITGVHYDINNLADVYTAIGVIQDEIGITGTTALEAEKTLTGSFASMKAAASNFMAQLVAGEDVSGAMDGLLDAAINFGRNVVIALSDILLNLPDALGHLGEVIMDKVEAFGNDPALKDAAANFVKDFVINIVKNAPKVLGAVAGLVALIISTLVRAAGALIQPAITAIANKFGAIKTALVAKAAAAIAALKAKFAAAKAAILHPFEVARDKVKAIIDKIKGFFNFKAATPKVKLPHFSISPAGWKISDLLKGKIPSLGIKWYAEGGVFNQPTIAGIGEAGPEAVMPLSKLKDYTAIDYDRLAGAIVSALSGADHTTVVSIDGREVARTTAPFMETELSRRQKMGNRRLGYI